MRSSRLTIHYSHEFIDLELSASVSPGSPGRLTGPPEDCYEPEAPEVDDVRLVLTPAQTYAVRELLSVYLITEKRTDADIVAFTLAVLRVIDPEFATGDAVDEAFVEALGTEQDAREAAEEDAAEARAEERREARDSAHADRGMGDPDAQRDAARDREWDKED